jgi:uncharacterized peroxidase-related enzyme
MSSFEIQTLDSAPAESKPVLQKLHAEIGFVPNLAATMAGSPVLIETFTTLRSLFQRTSFTPQEREVIAMNVAYQTGCTYCMAVHTTMAAKHGAPEAVLQAVREGQAPTDSRLRALSMLASQVAARDGKLTAEAVERFVEAGLTKARRWKSWWEWP